MPNDVFVKRKILVLPLFERICNDANNNMFSFWIFIFLAPSFLLLDFLGWCRLSIEFARWPVCYTVTNHEQAARRETQSRGLVRSGISHSQ